MDYTTLAYVKAAMDSQEVAADLMLSTSITRASRYIDKICTSQPNADNYFEITEVVNEVLTNGVVDGSGCLHVYPHKPLITEIVSLKYRYSMRQDWLDAESAYALLVGGEVMYEGNLMPSDLLQVKISYTGGLGTDVTELPQDLVDAATVMAIRLYKEARSGLDNTIGVAELGTLVYTKAFPQRVIELLSLGGYVRISPWM